MKKTITFSIIFLLLLCCFGTVISLKEVKNEQIKFQFSNFILEEIDNKITVKLQGTNSELIKCNQYIIPTRVETIFFPFGTTINDVRCMVSDIHRESIFRELYMTSAPAILGSNNGIVVPLSDSSLFTQSSWFDYDVGSGIVDNQRVVIVKMQMYPVQYHPRKNSIEWTEEISITIEYETSDGPTGVTDMHDLVILCPSDFSDELHPFIKHKNSRGLDTILVSLDEINNGLYFPSEGRDEPEQIKYFIKNAIEHWGIQFVLLVGGYDRFPVRIVSPQNSFISDVYYADIYGADGGFCSWDNDGDMLFGEYIQDDPDFYPDIYIGRFACTNETQVTDCIQKVMLYELNKSFTEEWFSNFVVIAGDDFPNQGISEGEYATQVAIDIMEAFTADPIWASNGRLSGTDTTGVDEINAALNNGPGFIYYSGHSSPTRFFTYPRNESRTLPTPTGYYSNKHIAALTNNEKLPIVVFDSCSPCNFHSNEDCLGWSFVSNPIGGGVGFLGATTYSLCYLGSEFTEGLAIKLALNFFNAYHNSNVSILGEVWNKAIIAYIFPNMTVGDYITLEEWEPFFDPTLTIRQISNPPEKPTTPIGQTSGKINREYNFSSFSSDLDGDTLFYKFDWGDGTDSGWLGPYPSGQTVSSSKSWSSKGNYTIKVQARDTSFELSPWSDPLPITMPYSFDRPMQKILDWLIERFPNAFPLL